MDTMTCSCKAGKEARCRPGRSGARMVGARRAYLDWVTSTSEGDGEASSWWCRQPASPPARQPASPPARQPGKQASMHAVDTDTDTGADVVDAHTLTRSHTLALALALPKGAACQVSGGAGLGSLRRQASRSFLKLLATAPLSVPDLTLPAPDCLAAKQSSAHDSPSSTPAAYSPPHTPHPRSALPSNILTTRSHTHARTRARTHACCLV